MEGLIPAPLAALVQAAKAWQEAKDAATECWVEHGKLTASVHNSLDKATDNLLVAVRGYRTWESQ